ncbi:MAG: DUF2911 domain-containing protein [Flavobacteriaceae bacterium]
MRKLFTLSILVVLLVFTTDAMAQDFSGLDKSPMDAAAYPSNYQESEKTVRIIYSRPQLKGRSLAELAPAGKVWRTGANEAPEITFYKDVNFGGQDIKAGTYSLFTIPGEKEWTIILNKNLNQWGAYSYSESDDLTRVSGSVATDGKSLDAFSTTFVKADGGADMVIGWGKTRITVPLKF